ncbi:MAG: TIGR03668 family PPOX class F420-dependent oxidoreductase [Haloarculaceae archaeon]
MFDARERAYVETARVGRLATADAEGRPHVVPVCFAFAGDGIVTPIDEKPQSVPADGLRRSRDVLENPRVALVVDHYTEDWSALGWVQVRGTAAHLTPGEPGYQDAVAALRGKYDQYADHALEERPVVRIEPGSVRSWGELERPRSDGTDGR